MFAHILYKLIKLFLTKPGSAVAFEFTSYLILWRFLFYINGSDGVTKKFDDVLAVV